MREKTKKIVFAIVMCAATCAIAYFAYHAAGLEGEMLFWAPALLGAAVLVLILLAYRFMKKNLWTKLTICAFAALLMFPGLSMAALSGVERENLENRPLNTEFPMPSRASYEEYPRQVEAYLNDMIPFRSEMVKVRNAILYKGFHTSPSDLVIAGKGDWLYYNAQDGSPDRNIDSTSDYMGTNLFSEEELAQMGTNLCGLKSFLDEKGIPLYVVVPPGKESVYPEYLPPSIYRAGDMTRVEQAKDYVSQTVGLDILYLKDVLVENKSSGYDLFINADSHWNMVGGYVAMEEIMRNIKPGYTPVPVQPGDVTVDSGTGGDLANMANINLCIDTMQSSLPPSYMRGVTYEHTEGNGMGFGMVNRIESTSENDEKLLLMHDSYFVAIEGYMAREYAEITHLTTDDAEMLTAELIEEENPDLVIIELVERNVYSVLGTGLAGWAGYCED